MVEKDGHRERQTCGTPQGAEISPLLANIVLHEAMDTMALQWRREYASGEIYLVRDLHAAGLGGRWGAGV